jgi:hypothetical protein
MLLGMGVFASAEGEQLTFRVSSTEAAPGDEIQIQVSLENNPGLAAVELVVDFDTNVLEWIEPAKATEAQEDYDGMWDVFVRNGETGVTVQWFGTGDNYYNDGLFCTLKFKVKDDAPAGESPVTLSFKEETVYNEDEVDQPFTVVPGKVTVSGSEEPTEGLTFRVSSTEAAPGDEIQIQVNLENNPGLAAVELVVDFDTNVLEWIEPAKATEAQEDYDGMWDVFVRNGETGVTVQWFGTGDNYYNDGLFCTLKFKVKDDAPAGESPVTLSFKEETVYNEDEVDQPFTVVPGKVTVTVPTIEDGYYLIGQKGWTVADIDPEQKFEPNPNNAGEYLLETFLNVGDGIKVVQVTNGEIAAWYPDGMDNQYIVDTAHSGRKTIYFKTSYDGNWSQFGGYMWIDAALTGAEVYGSSVSLKGDIALNFFLIIPNELKEDEGAYVTIGTEKFLIKDASTRTVGDYTLYQFTVKMNAKQMNDEVTLKVFNGADEAYKLFNHTTGEDVTEGYVYSVQTYIEKTIATSTDAKLVALVKAMSDYGSLAQAFMDYNLENRAEVQGDLSGVTLDTVTKYKSTTTAGTATGVTYKGGSLVLKSTTAIRLYFTLDEGEIGNYTFKLGKKAVTPVETADGWMIEIANISAKDLDKFYTVTVSSSAGTIVTVKYCGLSYVYTVLDTSSDAKLIDLAKGIYLYNQAADAYFSA